MNLLVTKSIQTFHKTPSVTRWKINEETWILTQPSRKVGAFSEGSIEFMTNLSPNQTSKISNGKFQESFFICGETAIRPTNFSFRQNTFPVSRLDAHPSRSQFSTPIASLTPSRHKRTTQCDSSRSNFDERLGLRWCRVKVTERKAFLKYLLSVLLLKPANLLKYHQEIYSKVLIIQSK